MNQDNQFVQEFVNAIRVVIGKGSAALHEPIFCGNEWGYVNECLDTGFVSSVGEFVDRFEEDLANYTGAKHAIAVVNGTSALHIALILAGVSHRDEVLVPALTFVATANAVSHCGAEPHFVDSEESTLGIDPSRLRKYLENSTTQENGKCVNKKTGRVISAMIPMHVFGHPVKIDELLSVANHFNIALVEDAAESLGSYSHGRHTGTVGLLGTLSFNGNKTITTGGGGAILTNNSKLARKAKHITTTAKLEHQWEYRHDEIAFNFRMPNINAALGCAQLENLPTFLESKRKLFSKYEEIFSSLEGLYLFKEPNRCSSNYWLQTILLDESKSNIRDLILKVTNEKGIMTRPAWVPINKLKPYEDCQSMELTVANSLFSRIINIPSGYGILK